MYLRYDLLLEPGPRCPDRNSRCDVTDFLSLPLFVLCLLIFFIFLNAEKRASGRPRRY